MQLGNDRRICMRPFVRPGWRRELVGGKGRGGCSGNCIVGLAFQQRRGPETYRSFSNRITSHHNNHAPRGATTSTPDSAPSANNGGLAAPLGPVTGGTSMTMEGGGLVMRVTLQA